MVSFFLLAGSAKDGIWVPGMPTDARAKVSLGSLLARNVHGLVRFLGQVRDPASSLSFLMPSPFPSSPWQSAQRSPNTFLPVSMLSAEVMIWVP